VISSLNANYADSDLPSNTVGIFFNALFPPALWS
jgi:hypothetical protein